MEFRNKIPMHTMYSMYKFIGEPLTIRNLVMTIQEQCSRDEELINETDFKHTLSDYQAILEEMLIYCPGMY